VSAHDDTAWARADRVFEAALELELAEREAHIAAACAGDAELETLVRRLLRYADERDEPWAAARDGSGGGAAAQDAPDPAREPDTPAAAGSDAHPLAGAFGAALLADLRGDEQGHDLAGARIDRYRVLRRLGAGGMAVVYLAERADGQYEQRVALKLVKRGVDSEEIVRRFERERRILALVDHRGIARLIDGGIAPDGRPYFVMEHVEGRPIERYCEDLGLDLEARLGLVLQVARAVEHAHRNLVVHCDIKPGNILVSAAGEAKLLDFGIAKLLAPAREDATLTRTAARPLTPAFASPEQLAGGPVTTASDIYQLGLLLRTLLVGRPARTAAGEATPDAVPPAPDAGATTRTLSAAPGTTQPRAPVARRPRRGDDLDTIIAMALRPEPERRYRDVGRLIDDVERYLAHRPISARPDTLVYRAGKFARRHRLGLALGAAALAGALLGVGLHTRRLAAERDRAQSAAAEARQMAGLLRDLFQASSPKRTPGREPGARELLAEGARRIDALSGQPVLQGDLLTLIGGIQLDLGLYDDARRLLERAVSTLRAAGVAGEVELGRALVALGRLRHETGPRGAAEPLLREALARLERRLGARHVELVPALCALGVTLESQGRFEPALAALDRAVALREREPGVRQVELGLALLTRSSVLRGMARFEAARASAERALVILEPALGADHPHVADARTALADSLRFLGRADEARAAYERALAVVERAYGAQHAQTALVLSKLGNLLNGQARTVEARAHHLRALAIRERALGARHPSVAATLNNLGNSYVQERRFGEARAAYARALELWAATLGPEHLDTAIAQRNLGEVLLALGRPRAARPLLARALRARERAHGARHGLLSSPLLHLGLAHLAEGDARAAEPLLRRSVSLGRATPAHRYPEGVLPRLALARCLLRLDRAGEAQRWAQEALALAPEVESPAEGREARRRALVVLARIHRAAGRGDEARRAAAEAAALPRPAVYMGLE
jgi:serine/threonine-protein kinase